MQMWGRLKGQVTNLRPRSDKDVDENDTVVSRALLRYYDPQVPHWLIPPGGLPHTQYGGSQMPPEKSPSPQPLPTYAPRRSVESKPHMFDRMDRTERRDSAASVNVSSGASAKPSSGLASRLKNSKW